jgi:hypothetical protein
MGIYTASGVIPKKKIHKKMTKMVEKEKTAVSLTYKPTTKPQTMKNLKNIIETKLNKKVDFFQATDCANLLYTAKINGLTVANIYKSFDGEFNQVYQIRYTNAD